MCYLKDKHLETITKIVVVARSPLTFYGVVTQIYHKLGKDSLLMNKKDDRLSVKDFKSVKRLINKEYRRLKHDSMIRDLECPTVKACQNG